MSLLVCETHVIFLNVVTSEKNQEKHKRQFKRQVVHNNCNNSNKIYKDNI